MRRVSVLVSVFAVVLLGLVAVGGMVTTAQDATPAAMARHPLVGTWVVDTDADNPDNALSVATVGADGTYHEVDADGTSGLGAWRATGDRTAELVILYPEEEGTLRVRAAFELAADDQEFTATYTLEFVGPDEAGTGEYGPATATGTRLEAEAPGTPVGTIGDLFAAFEGTPESGTPTP